VLLIALYNIQVNQKSSMCVKLKLKEHIRELLYSSAVMCIMQNYLIQ